MARASSRGNAFGEKMPHSSRSCRIIWIDNILIYRNISAARFSLSLSNICLASNIYRLKNDEHRPSRFQIVRSADNLCLIIINPLMPWRYSDHFPHLFIPFSLELLKYILPNWKFWHLSNSLCHLKCLHSTSKITIDWRYSSISPLTTRQSPLHPANPIHQSALDYVALRRWKSTWPEEARESSWCWFVGPAFICKQ